MKKLDWTGDSSTRLDVYVQQSETISRGLAQQLINDGNVTVNGVVEKVSYKLSQGDKIIINFNVQGLRKIPEIDLPILYEDDDCIVLDKPEGILTHSKGAFNPEPTVASFIKLRLTGMEGERAGIVHRLDRATSGVMICAKNPSALQWLQKQFSQRKTKKTYIAVVPAGLKPNQAVIDMPIERDPKQPKKFRVGKNGKPAQTEYKTIETTGEHTLLELKPHTGRTHQLRVHLKQLGYPIIGDVLYEGEPAKRLMLHAHQLELTLPNKVRQTFTSPLPQAFKL